jgi:hypothetical protein
MLSRANRHLSTQFSGIELAKLSVFLCILVWRQTKRGKLQSSKYYSNTLMAVFELTELIPAPLKVFGLLRRPLYFFLRCLGNLG